MTKDYKKAEQAINMLKESGVDFVLAFGNGNGHRIATQGEYKDVKQCIICALTRAATVICDNGHEAYIAVGELQKMTNIATELWYQERKDKEWEKRNDEL